MIRSRGSRLLALFILGLLVAGTLVVLRRTRLDQAIAALKEDRPGEARDKLRPLATIGDKKAQYLIGYMCALGLGGPRNAEEALKWFRRSSGWVRPNSHEVAMDALYVATAFAEGTEGVQKNDGEAVNWLKIASENGSKEAADRLGRAYAEGLLGLPRDPQQAEYWRRRIK